MRTLCIVLLSLLVNVNLFAFQKATVKAGELQSVLEKDNVDLSTLRDLVIEGEMDARDFKFIAEQLPALSSLDISKANIKAYSSNESLLGNYVSFNENELPPMSFMGSKLNTIVLPETLKTVGEGAFTSSAIEVVNLPQSVVELKALSFNAMPNLKQVTGGAGLQKIGDYAFSHCPLLSVFPTQTAVSSIAPYAFLDCPKMVAFTFPVGLKQIGEGAFKDSGLTDIDLSQCKSLDVIGAWAFADVDALETIRMPKAVSTVGVGAFCFNTVKNKVEFPETLTKINDLTFAETEFPGEIQIPEGVDTVGNFAYAGWNKAVRMLIPASVDHIGERAFRNWTSLNLLICYATTPPTLGEDVWEGLDKSNVNIALIPEYENLYKTVDQWKDFFTSGAVIVPKDDSFVFSVRDDILSIRSAIAVKSFTLFDISGILLATGTPNQEQVAIDLSNFGGNLFVVRCVLENNEVKFIKIACN